MKDSYGEGNGKSTGKVGFAFVPGNFCYLGLRVASGLVLKLWGFRPLGLRVRT